MSDYPKIHTPEHVFITRQAMDEMENILPANRFIRIHKSYMLAFARIKNVFGNSVALYKAPLPIGLNIKERIIGFIGGKY